MFPDWFTVRVIHEERLAQAEKDYRTQTQTTLLKKLRHIELKSPFAKKR
jgi:hypothetical protein